VAVVLSRIYGTSSVLLLLVASMELTGIAVALLEILQRRVNKAFVPGISF
jgi:hypothetical protein